MAKGTFGRLGDIWRSNVNELLDKMEDPEKMVRQVVRDMEDAVDRAVEALARAVADQRRLEKQDVQLRTEIETWQQKAESAVEAGDEEGARQTLAKKAGTVRMSEELGPTLDESRQTVAELRGQLEEMRRRLQQARNRQGQLIARYRAASQHLGGEGAGGGSESDPFARFQRIEQRVQAHEADFARFEQQVDTAVAEADLYREMATQEKKEDRELQEMEMEREKRIDAELAAMRDKVKKNA